MTTKLDFSNASILVFGDIMLDSYWRGSTERISPEAPVPVVNISNIIKKPGAAANVALNIHALGAQVTLLGLCGNDQEGYELETLLKSYNIKSSILKDDQLKTITKLRVSANSQQLIRLDFEESYTNSCKKLLLEQFETLLSDVNYVVLSDYAKGTLTDVAVLIQCCRSKGVPVIIDPKGNDYSKYKGASLLTPNEKEFETIVGQCESESVFFEKGMNLLKCLGLDSLLVTRGAKGMTYFQKQREPLNLPTKAKSVYDVTGAGDTVISILSTCLASGIDIEQALSLSNYGAGIVVGQLGATAITKDDLTKMYHDTSPLSYIALATILKGHIAKKERFLIYNYADIKHSEDWLQLHQKKNQNIYIYIVIDSTTKTIHEAQQIFDFCQSFDCIDNVASLTPNETIDIKNIFTSYIFSKTCNI